MLFGSDLAALSGAVLGGVGGFLVARGYSCASRAGCGSRVLNKLGPQTTHTIVVPSAEPLAPGQKVELGIAGARRLAAGDFKRCPPA